MAYTDEQMREISRDPERLRAYFWHVAMNARRIAIDCREESKRTAVTHPVTNYRPVFTAGRDLIAKAEHMDRFSASIFENIDLLVESTVERDEMPAPAG